MKRILLLLICSFFVFNSFAQSKIPLEVVLGEWWETHAPQISLKFNRDKEVIVYDDNTGKSHKGTYTFNGSFIVVTDSYYDKPFSLRLFYDKKFSCFYFRWGHSLYWKQS